MAHGEPEVDHDLGPWEPMSLADVAERFSAGSPMIWWVCGGEALDLFVGHQTRSHADLDVSILRQEAAQLPTRLPGWDLQLAHRGVLTPWPGTAIAPPYNSLWCRRRPNEPWRLQIMLEEGDTQTWVCRRYPELTMPMHDLVRHSPDGVPFVTPEVQLFMKAKDPRPKDDVDFAVVTPLLHTDARAWLLDAIRTYFPDHPWLKA